MFKFLADVANEVPEPQNIKEWFDQLGDAIVQMFTKGTIIDNYATNSFFGRLIMVLIICVPCIVLIKVLFKIIKSFKHKKIKTTLQVTLYYHQLKYIYISHNYFINSWSI